MIDALDFFIVAKEKAVCIGQTRQQKFIPDNFFSRAHFLLLQVLDLDHHPLL
jgi:hypothetical protein